MGFKKLTLLPEQEQYIKENFRNYTHLALADKMGLKVNTVRKFCDNNKLKKNRKTDANPEPRKIVPYNPPEKVKHVPPPAVYSSGWEATIEKYLKKEI
jgi:hypothetical protein